ncbi:MAG: hypothetical protein K8I82_25555 [Anaerolineae bacterium]|nr:hypothetical protein [Anaerolineae bacterium]
MQNGKNKPKSLGEEGSEVSVQMVKCTECKYNTEGRNRNKSVIFCHLIRQYRSQSMERTCPRFIIFTERKKIMKYAISRTTGPKTTPKTTKCRLWLVTPNVWSLDPGDAIKFDTKEEAKNFHNLHKTSGMVQQLK